MDTSAHSGETSSPYRDPGTDPPPPGFALDDARAAPPSRWTVLLLAAFAATLAWVGATAFREHRLGLAVANLPAAAQLATYRDVRDELRTLCAADRERLYDRCRDEASFLLKFPQCDDECRALAMPFLGASAPR